MIRTIAILVYVVPTVIIACILAIKGWKKGWLGGTLMIGFTALSVLGAYLLAGPIATEIESWDIVHSLQISAIDAAEAMGMESLLFMNLLSASIHGIVMIPVCMLLFLIFIIVINLIWMAVKSVLNMEKKEQSRLSSIIGMSLGILTPVLLAIFLLTVPQIDILAEAKNADVAMELSEIIPTLSADEVFGALGTLDDEAVLTCTDLYFNTTLLAATQEERLEILNAGINGALGQVGNQAVTDSFSSVKYESREALNHDLTTILALVQSLKLDRFQDTGDIITCLQELPDKEAFVEKLYSLQFSEPLIRLILCEAVRAISGDDTYEIPADCKVTGTQKEFTELLEVLTDIINEDIDLIDAAMQLRNSPLIAPEVFAKLSSGMQ